MDPQGHNLRQRPAPEYRAGQQQRPPRADRSATVNVVLGRTLDGDPGSGWDSETAKWFAQELASLFGATRVSSETDGEIQVELRGETNDALDKTLIAIERWLGEAGIGSAKVCVGEQSYVVERPRVSRSPERRPARQIAQGSELSVLEGSQMKGSSKGARFIRRANNSVYDVLVKLGIEDGEFWCECDDPGCEERVVLTLREYAALRDRHGEPLLSRSHALPQVCPGDRHCSCLAGLPQPEAHATELVPSSGPLKRARGSSSSTPSSTVDAVGSRAT